MTPMPLYAILRFQKCKAGGVACCDRHNERKRKNDAEAETPVLWPPHTKS